MGTSLHAPPDLPSGKVLRVHQTRKLVLRFTLHPIYPLGKFSGPIRLENGYLASHSTRFTLRECSQGPSDWKMGTSFHAPPDLPSGKVLRAHQTEKWVPRFTLHPIYHLGKFSGPTRLENGYLASCSARFILWESSQGPSDWRLGLAHSLWGTLTAGIKPLAANIPQRRQSACETRQSFFVAE
jgi:hypothetical protein